MYAVNSGQNRPDLMGKRGSSQLDPSEPNLQKTIGEKDRNAKGRKKRRQIKPKTDVDVGSVLGPSLLL